MKKLFLFSFLTIFLSLTFVNDADAQRRKKKKSSKNDEYFDESGNFTSKLWYGAGFVLNFGTDFLPTSAGTFRGNTFLFGVSPMVGYKIMEGLSVGPRVELLFRNSKYDIGGGEDLSFSSFNYGAGLFARFKFPGAIFIHSEYQRLSEEVGVGIDFNRNEVLTTRASTDNFFIGGGYSQGDIVGFEFSILWNLAEEFTSDNIPIYYRLGVNYKFH